jgi:holo-[acyl-carrier protein] synthase
VIVGIGIDLVDVARIRRHVGPGAGTRGERFVARCFTEGEQAYCNARRDRASHYAVRFAAKEAAMKALGTPDGLRFTDVEVARAGGAPTLLLHGAAARAAAALRVDRIHLALTHDAGVAAATVVLEGGAP